MTSSMQNFRHFWFNVQDFALAGLAVKIRQSSNLQKAEEAQWNGLSGVSSQIWPQASRFGARGQNVLGSCTIFQTLRFSSITSKIWVLQRRIWHHRVLSLRQIECYPISQKKIKIWPAQFGFTGQSRSQLVILGIIRFGATKHFGTHFIRLSPLVPRLRAEE